jgi:hypothetical protein
MTTSDKPPRYRVYLLRLWEERGQRSNNTGAWRFSLEDPHTGERRGFANLEALIDSLRAELTSDEKGPLPDSVE